MRRFALWLFVAAIAVYCCNGVKSPDIEQFWLDDYKAFDDLYSRTSDKDLYRRSVLPSPINYPSRDLTKIYNSKKQGHVDKEIKQFGDLFDAEEYPYADKYIRVLAEQTLKSYDKTKPRPGTKYFTNSYFKPINKKNNADLYNYLERLESYAHRKGSPSYKHEKLANEYKTKHALVYSAASPVRCGKTACSTSKRPSKITRINGPYLKRVKHRIIRY